MTSLLPPQLVAALGALMISATFVAPWPETPWLARPAGLIAMALGLATAIFNAGRFDRLKTNIKTFDDPDVLVRDGAFDHTRNPMYLGFAVFLVGLAITLGSAIAFTGPLAFFIAADRWYIPFEERRMTASFGREYEQYRLEVRRWLGRRSTR